MENDVFMFEYLEKCKGYFGDLFVYENRNEIGFTKAFQNTNSLAPGVRTKIDA